MHKRHNVKIGFASIVTAALAGSTLVAAPAQAADNPRADGNQSLATVLAADSGFDRNGKDFDILEMAVGAVLEAKPNSPVKALTKGGTRLTAFAPTDLAFRRLARDLTKTAQTSERSTFRTLAKAVDVDTLESVLLYHVVAGKTLGSNKVLARKDKKVRTALGEVFTVRIRNKNVFLDDQDRNDKNPKVVELNINRGNKQIAHGIDRVLRPIDL